MISNYNELNKRVIDIIEQLEKQGYEYVEGSALAAERSSKNDFILERHLQKALKHLNPHFSDEELINYLQTILNIKASSLTEASQIFSELLIDKKYQLNSSKQYESLKIIDFYDVENNEFIVATDFLVEGDIRFDFVIFINGLPLVVMAVTNSDEFYDEKLRLKLMQRNRKEMFYYNQFMVITNARKELEIGFVPYTWVNTIELKEFFPKIHHNYDELERSQDSSIAWIFQKNILLNLIQNVKRIKEFSLNLISPNGEGAVNDRITHIDLLDRDNLIRELSNFYIEYSEQNPFPFYFGIFGRWGMGKSSVNEILTKKIQEHSSEEYEYLVLKTDCSLFHKKDKLWISILNDLLDLLSKEEVKKEVFQSKFPSFKMKFFWGNLKSWLKGNWWSWSFLLPIISLIYILYGLYTASFPTMLQPKDFKETAAMVSIVTFIYGLLKTVSLLIKQNIFLRDNRNENSSYVQSLKEFKQLINLMNNTKKKKNIKILIILDELDRLHKDLLPDIIELIQIFKGLNNNSAADKDNEEKTKKENSSVISFVFSFNHDILFPVIGSNVALNDKQLLVSSYRKYKGFVEEKENDAYIDYYKLGKEFMDKYLDLSIYLEREIDYTRLVKELFGEKNEPNISNRVKESELSMRNEYVKVEEDGVHDPSASIQKQQEVVGGNLSNQSNINKNKFSSFSELEMEVIVGTINKYAAKVEPRKVIRLKNALIMLKKLNQEVYIETNSLYREELEKFIVEFLDINDLEEKGTNKHVEKQRNRETCNGINNNKVLKFTEYFIHKNN